MKRTDAAILRPRIMAALLAVPLSTSEIADRIEDQLTAEGVPPSWFGRPQIRLPTSGRCCHCDLEHPWARTIPVGTGLIRPHLDALARIGAVVKISRGSSRSSLWMLTVTPDTVGELLGTLTED